MDKLDNIHDLLGKRLARETTAEEDLAVQNWLKESPDNEQYFNDFQWVWAQTHGIKATKQVDTEGALQKLHQRMDALPALKPVRKPTQIFNLSFIMKVAAVFLVGIFIYNQFSKPETPVVLTASVAPKTDTLTDGSVITLNKKSALALSERYNKRERRMKLTGEAYFQVAHNTERPFVVEVQDLEVVAVGTAFNIDNNTDARYTDVMVTEGKVKVSSPTQTVYAERGETAIYDSQTGTILLEKRGNENKIAYKTRQFRFDETPLSIVVAEISKAYQVNIIFKNKGLESCPVVVSFDNKPLEDILTVLSTTCGFTFERVGDDILLSK